MPNFLVSQRFASTTVWLAIFASLNGAPRARSQTNDKTPTVEQDQAPFRLKVASNLVVVRVVVRDAQGKPVEGLKKEDFKLFDRGKEQSITQFDVETSVAPPNPAGAHAPGQVAPTTPPTMPGKFLAFYFDDLNASDADMIQARDAADHYLAAHLQPKDRVAIFTSGKMLSDFTADPKQIHDALFNLHVSTRALKSVRDCPDLSDYQAQEIAEFGDDEATDAMKVAIDEAIGRCHMTETEAVRAIPIMARSVLDQAQIQARTSLQELEQVVKYISQMPGQRTVILVSPGFLSQSEQFQLDRMIDQALRSQVVISSLDPKGLALLMRETDVTVGYHPPAGSGVIGSMHNVDSRREILATDVLAAVAQGTGGEFFHNNNDLQAGFGALAGSPVYYILAFAPSDTKADGRFHSLKVSLSEKVKGVSIQARRGYFAVKEGPEFATENQHGVTSDPDAQIKERIRETTLSKTEMRELPVEVRTEIFNGPAMTNELSVLAHLDTKSLHFHKEGEHSQNTVTFVSVVFDGSGNYVAGQQRQAKVDAASDALPNLLAAGMSVKMTFQLKPGSYTIREVVTDSEEHLMTAFSRNVTIP